jgi:hypothetical protein
MSLIFVMFYFRRILDEPPGDTGYTNILCIITGQEMYECIPNIYTSHERKNKETNHHQQSIRVQTYLKPKGTVHQY